MGSLGSICVGGIVKKSATDGLFCFKIISDDVDALQRLKDCNIQFCMMQGFRVVEETGYHDRQGGEVLIV